MAMALNHVKITGPAFGDHLSRGEVDRQVCALLRPDDAPVERGNADAPDESQDKQDPEPLGGNEKASDQARVCHFYFRLHVERAR